MTNYSAFRGRTRRPGVIDDNALSVSPSNISGCIGWYDASNISGVDGDLVSLWEDLSPVKRNATGSGVNRPTLKTNIVNGKPVVRFAGSHFLDMGAFISIPATYFIVWSRVNAGNNDIVFVSGLTTYAYLQYGSTHYVASSVSATVAMPASIFYLKCVTYNGSTSTIFTNGTSSATISNTLAMDHRYMGIQDAGGSGALYGDIAEIIFYDSSLVPRDRINIESYLNRKYNLW